jgi:hypothetical protein
VVAEVIGGSASPRSWLTQLSQWRSYVESEHMIKSKKCLAVVVAVVATLGSQGVVRAQEVARAAATSVVDTSRAGGLRQSMTAEAKRQALADVQAAPPAPTKKPMSRGAKIRAVAVIAGAVIGATYLYLWSRAD